MSFAAKLQRASRRLAGLACTLSALALFPMMLLTTVDIIGRSLFRRPVSGAVELSSYMLSLVILLGLAYALQAGAFPRVTLLVHRLPYRHGLWVEAMVTALGLFMVSILVWQGWIVALGPAASIVSAVLRIPQLPFRLLVPAGGLLLFLQLLADLVTALESLAGREGQEEKAEAPTTGE